MSDNNQPEWMNDPSVRDIDPEKLRFLQTLVFESNNLSRDQMLPFMMSLIKRGRDKNISFTDPEMDAIISVLKKYSSSEELEKINKIMAMRRKR